MNKISIIKKLSICNFIIIALFLLLIVGCNSGTKEEENKALIKKAAVTDKELVAAADELDQLFLIAFNNRDADAIMKLYWNSPEVSLYSLGEMEIKGYDAIKANFVKDFEKKGVKLEYTDRNNIPFGDVVVAFGTFRITMPIKGSSPMVINARYTEAKAFKDGKMVIIHDHGSMPLPIKATNTNSLTN